MNMLRRLLLQFTAWLGLGEKSYFWHVLQVVNSCRRNKIDFYSIPMCYSSEKIQEKRENPCFLHPNTARDYGCFLPLRMSRALAQAECWTPSGLGPLPQLLTGFSPPGGYPKMLRGIFRLATDKRDRDFFARNRAQ